MTESKVKVLRTVIMDSHIELLIADAEKREDASLWIDARVKLPQGNPDQRFGLIHLAALRALQKTIGEEIEVRANLLKPIPGVAIEENFYLLFGRGS